MRVDLAVEWKQSQKHPWLFDLQMSDPDNEGKFVRLGAVAVISGGFVAHFNQAGRAKSKKFIGGNVQEIARFLKQNWENENA